jgi:palmitoyl-protein thioesterase
MTLRPHSMISKLIISFAALLTLTGAAPYEQKPLGLVPEGSPRPVVIWHGLGDTSTGSGMAQFKEDLEEMYPGIYVMNVKIPAGGTLDDERKAGFVSRDEQSC